MVDVIDGQGAIEQAQSDRLRATAVQVGSAALSSVTLATAQAVIRSVQANEGGGIIGEPAADLRRLRTDPALMQAFDRDLRTAGGQALLLISDALWIGYRTGLEGRSAAMETPQLVFRVRLNEADRRELEGYPILGHTALEAAAHLVDRLRYEANAALAQPLTGTIDPTAIPVAMSQVSLAHGARLGGAVAEAHAAGVQAAVRAIGAALTGAA